MPLTPNLPAVILDTILGRLAPLFLIGAGGDLIAAHRAAAQMLAAYHPETEDELSLAAEIISFSYQMLEALTQAADPDLPLTRKLRVRGGAVSLSRQSHKARHKLDQIQKARHAEVSAQPKDAAPAPKTEPVVTEARQSEAVVRKAVPVTAKIGRQSWTQGYQQRLAATRIVENLKRNQMNTALPVAVGACSQGDSLTR
jgi:hypothetical protein